MSGLSRNATIAETAMGNSRIRRKRGKKLRHRLNDVGEMRPCADPYANRNPDHCGDGDQDHNAGQSREPEKQRRCDVRRRDVLNDKASDLPKSDRCESCHDRGPLKGDPAVLFLRFAHHQRGALGPAREQQAPPHGSEWPHEPVDQPGATQNGEHPRMWQRRAWLLFEAEAVRPSHQRPEQHLVVDQDHDQHGQDCIANRGEIPMLDGERNVGADTRQRDCRVTDADRLGSDDKEPASGHRQHHVPDELWGREWHIDPPEPHPGTEPEVARRLDEFGRHRAQRLVEAERHVPGLAGENREDGREFGAEDATRRERHEEHDGNRDEAEDRH